MEALNEKKSQKTRRRKTYIHSTIMCWGNIKGIDKFTNSKVPSNIAHTLTSTS
jgi:hypothetical protein